MDSRVATDHYNALLPMAQRLDEAYAAALDKLALHLREAASINRRVSSILESKDVQVLPVSDHAYSPRDVFYAFADALAQKVMPILQAGGRRVAPRIHDLVDWTDGPGREQFNTQDYVLAKIDHARSKTMVHFLEQLIIRYAPDSLPELAGYRATEDLIAIFSVVTAMGTAIPVRRGESPLIIRYVLRRDEYEPMWQILPRHHAGIARAANALATLALLNKEHQLAGAIGDMLTTFDVRMEQALMRYEADTAFSATAFLKIKLQRDGVDFHFGQRLYDIMTSHLSARVTDLQFVFH